MSTGFDDFKVNWISSSDSDIDHDEGTSDQIEPVSSVENVDDVILPLMALNIYNSSHRKDITSNNMTGELSDNFRTPWRSVLSKLEVWYATYGSNMWEDRFLCYIKGGKVVGMNKPCCGSRDKSSPRDIMWKIVPHKLFFGRSHTATWGTGGVAFLHPESNTNDKAYVCMYRITLEQFNDVLIQENGIREPIESPLLDASHLELLAENKTMLLQRIKGGWYSNVLCLGKNAGIPILTMTCSLPYVERFESGELPMFAPSDNYMKVLVKGLVEGKQLNQEEAIEYLQNAFNRKL